MRFRSRGEIERRTLGVDDDMGAVPNCCTSDGFVRDVRHSKGFAIESLDPGTVLVVRTHNSEYRIVVLDGARHNVIVKGGLLLPEPTEASLQGSSFGGIFIRAGWIGVGLRLEILVDRQRIVTSRVRSITIESVPPPPRDTAASH